MKAPRAAVLHPFILCMGVTLLSSLPLTAQDPPSSVHAATAFDVSPPLRDLARLPVRRSYGLY